MKVWMIWALLWAVAVLLIGLGPVGWGVLAFFGLLLLVPARLYCYLGLHHWSHPGGFCFDCRKHDDFFDKERL